MRNGTSQSPFRPALGRQLVRAADAPLRGHGFGTSRLRQTPTTNGLTAYRMRLHLACVSSGTYGPFATSASRSRLRLPRTTRLALRASLAGSERRFNQSVAVLGMRNGTSQSPFRPALGRQLVRAADAPLRGHGFGTSRLRQTPTTNGLTAYRMRLHLACVSSGTYGPFATSASRSRLRLPRTTRLALRASLAGSDCPQSGNS